MTSRVTDGPTVTVDLRAESQVGAVKIVVVDGPDLGTELPVGGEVVIGSDPSCDLVLADPTVSRKHAALSTSETQLLIRDLGSRNGTFVAGTKVVEASLTPGAVVKIGRTCLALHPTWFRRAVEPSKARRFGQLYGTSLAMREVFAVLERASRSDVNVLIEGETGTGKEVAARSLHLASERSRRPFVAFDCASVPPALAESELFGHVRGAFSGAVGDREGAFERADGGTLFLDEMGELPAEIQPKLLRALEEREIRRVGGSDDLAVDVRLIVATNRDLHAEVARGRFRADLLYRLDVVRVRLPPLRQRPEDIAGLATQLLMGRLEPGDEVAGPNLHELMAYGWPGNVRELRNVLHRAVTMRQVEDGLVRFADLVLNLGPSPVPSSFGVQFPGIAEPLPFKEAKQQLLTAFERAYVDALVTRHDGNISRAAGAAGLSRKHLYDLLKKSRER